MQCDGSTRIKQVSRFFCEPFRPFDFALERGGASLEQGGHCAFNILATGITPRELLLEPRKFHAERAHGYGERFTFKRVIPCRIKITACKGAPRILYTADGACDPRHGIGSRAWHRKPASSWGGQGSVDYVAEEQRYYHSQRAAKTQAKLTQTLWDPDWAREMPSIVPHAVNAR